MSGWIQMPDGHPGALGTATTEKDQEKSREKAVCLGPCTCQCVHACARGGVHAVLTRRCLLHLRAVLQAVDPEEERKRRRSTAVLESEESSSSQSEKFCAYYCFACGCVCACESRVIERVCDIERRYACVFVCVFDDDANKHSFSMCVHAYGFAQGCMHTYTRTHTHALTHRTRVYAYVHTHTNA